MVNSWNGDYHEEYIFTDKVDKKGYEIVYITVLNVILEFVNKSLS